MKKLFKDKPILEFQGNYRWLSNFYPCRIEYFGYVYKSVEHSYQAQKSNSQEWKTYCEKENNPALVRKKSRNIMIIENWDDLKYKIMNDLLELKFSQPAFKIWLKNTGNSIIEEGNYWGDVYWGIDMKSGKGYNHLGKLIMSIRDIKIVRSAYIESGLKGKISEIVSGTARGVDQLGERLASELNIPVKRFPANWDLFGKSAGYKRNVTMADYADGLIAIWDGKSKGTGHMINIMTAKGKWIYVFKY